MSLVAIAEQTNGLVEDGFGRPRPGVNVLVTTPGTTDQVQVYADRAGTAPVSQPVSTNAYGYVQGYVAAEQVYDVYDPATGLRATAEAVASEDVAHSVGSNMADGRYVVAARYPNTFSSALGNGAGWTGRTKHVVRTACSDLRVLIGGPFNIEALSPTSQVRVKVGIEYPAAPVTQLSAALSTGAPITSLPVPTLPTPGAGNPLLASPASVTLTDPTGAHSQTWALTAAANGGATSLAVTSQTPNFAYPAGSTITSPVIYPVTVGGQAYGTLDQYGHVLTDPCPIELPAGTTIYVRIYQQVPFTSGPGYLTLTGGPYAIGVQSVQTTAPPTGQLPQVVTLDQGASAETVTVVSYSGTASPYTLNFAALTTKAHNAGAVIGQPGFSNCFLYADNGDVHTNQDLSWSGTFAANAGLNASTTTLQAVVNAGDSSFKVAAPVPGDTLTVDTGGTPETVTVRTWTGTANPYTVYIVGTFAGGHANGATVQGTVLNSTDLAPVAVVADRVTGVRAKSVLIVGDSIPNGTGYGKRQATSYITLALDAANIPYVNITKAGESAFQFVMSVASHLRRRLATLCDWAFYEYGANDVYGAQTVAEMQANTLAILAALKSRGLRVAVSTLTPRTTSTDNFLTAANQTLVVAGENTNRIAYNNWLRAWQTNGLRGVYVDALVDVANSIEANAAGVLTQDGGLWYADANGPYTADGIHPSTAGHVKMGAGVPAASIFA